jgi:hypothetical protein
MRRSTDPRLFGAALLLAAAVLVFGASLARALGGPDVQPPPADTPGTPSHVPAVEAAPDGEALPVSALLLAVDHDPFRPERQRAPERYLLPGETLPEAPPPPPAPPAPPPFRLVGTVVTPEGGLAMLQLENSTPRMLAMGESMLGYTVTRVTSEGAVLEGQGGQVLSLLLARAVAVAGPPAAGARGGPQGRGNMPPGAAQAFGAAQERVNAITRAMEQGGVQSPEMLEAMRRLLENVGPGLMGSDVRIGGGETIIMRRTVPDTIRPPNRNN